MTFCYSRNNIDVYNYTDNVVRTAIENRQHNLNLMQQAISCSQVLRSGCCSQQL